MSTLSSGPIDVIGVVLAGGQSRRMGGDDKFLQPVHGSNLLQAVLNRLSPQLDTIIISSNSPAQTIHAALKAHKQFNEIPIVSDLIPDFAGPLAGVHSAMKWAQDNRPETTHLLTVAADTPFFPLDFVSRMVGFAQSKEASSIILAQSHGRFHPIFGLWPVDLQASLEGALFKGLRKIRAWTNEHPNASLSFDNEIINGKQVDPFFNVNEPDDFEHYKMMTSSEKL